jgi:hypothetical protein
MGKLVGGQKGGKGSSGGTGSGGDLFDDSEFVTLTVHRACAQDFLFALNQALGGGGKKKKNGKNGKNGKKGGGGKKVGGYKK